jgi:hypothetical protein
MVQVGRWRHGPQCCWAPVASHRQTANARCATRRHHNMTLWPSTLVGGCTPREQQSHCQWPLKWRAKPLVIHLKFMHFVPGDCRTGSGLVPCSCRSVPRNA